MNKIEEEKMIPLVREGKDEKKKKKR